MRWGPLKSAEKPHPWAVDHEPMGPGAMGSVGGGPMTSTGGGAGGWAWQGAYGMGVGVGGWGGAGAIYRTSIGSHAGRGMRVGAWARGG